MKAIWYLVRQLIENRFFTVITWCKTAKQTPNIIANHTKGKYWLVSIHLEEVQPSNIPHEVRRCRFTAASSSADRCIGRGLLTWSSESLDGKYILLATGE